MKFYFNKAIVIIFLGLPCIVYCQGKKQDIDTIGVFETMKDEIVYMFGKVEITQEGLNYQTANRKWDSAKQRNLKWMLVNSRTFLCLPLKKSGNDMQLMEVLAISKKYILVQYWYDWYHYLIFDHQGNMVMEKTKVYDRGQTIGARKNNTKVLEGLKTYFKDCPRLIDDMSENLANEELLSHDIEVIECEGSPALESIIDVMQKKYWTKK